MRVRLFSRPWLNSAQPVEGLTAADFAKPGPFFRMGRAPVGFNVLITKEAAGRLQDLADRENGKRDNDFPPFMDRELPYPGHFLIILRDDARFRRFGRQYSM